MNFLKFIFLTFVGIILLMDVAKMVNCRRLDKRAVFYEEADKSTKLLCDEFHRNEWFFVKKILHPISATYSLVDWKCEEIDGKKSEVNSTVNEKNNSKIDVDKKNNINITIDVKNQVNNKDNNTINEVNKVNKTIDQVNKTDVKPETFEICQTNVCHRTARSISDNMDNAVDPCDDFYQFSCGNFLKNTEISENETIDSFSRVKDDLERKVKSFIEAEIEPKEIKPFKLPKILYKSCMNEQLIEKQGLDPFKEILKELGGWPVLMGDEWKDDDFDWKKVISKHRKVGSIVFYFMDFTIDIDQENKTNNLIQINPPQFNIGIDRLLNGLNDTLVNAYLEYMTDVAVTLGANRELASKDMKEALEFEIELANITLQYQLDQESWAPYKPWYNPISLRELIKAYPSISWADSINIILDPITSVTEDEVINVSIPSSLYKVIKLLEKKPKRVLANYILWRLVERYARDLNEVIRNKRFEFLAKEGNVKKPTRLQECLDEVSSRFYTSIISFYARKYFDKDAKTAATQVFTGIKRELEKSLETVDWMDEPTRKAALEKAKFMDAKIAYPDEILDDKQLQEYYQNLELIPKNHLQNMINISRFIVESHLKTLRKPLDKKDWTDSAFQEFLSVKYLPKKNTLNLPTEVLQGTFFGKDRPEYMNYGAIGWLIGSEITHGFDSIGRYRDKDGNFKQSLDWNRDEKYLDRIDCFIDQTNNFTNPVTNGRLNKIEVIADNAGIKLAYQTYKLKNVIEPRLPEFKDYSPEQMFWISAANNYCEKKSNKNDHNSGSFRVINSMSNMLEFSKDFKCKPDSNMNPEKKCNVW